MLSHIPTHIIGGPLGAGKTSLIRHLLTQRPNGERWAVLVNEFGAIGLDAALMASSDRGITISEVAGGCVCCVNGVPFQVALTRLLRKAKPMRLFIEPSGLGHPIELLQQLSAAPWTGVLTVQPLVTVLDARALDAGEPLPPVQLDAVERSGLLVLNKTDQVDEQRLKWLTEQFAQPVHSTVHGTLELRDLPLISASDLVPGELPGTDSVKMPTVWRDERVPFRQSHAAEEGWSIGWRYHPSVRFDPVAFGHWLASLDWRRAKVILATNTGWQSANMLGGAAIEWHVSAWRRDSRIELIFQRQQDEAWLQAGLDACRMDGPPS
ncbi:CobW family GTP-binding protein [Pseudomonas sp. Marseille-QA0892]